MSFFEEKIVPKKNIDVLNRVERIAVHASDLDGIASAAIMLLLKPAVKIDFLSVNDAKNAVPIYDMVIDLPKIGNAINIDHHQTNYDHLIVQQRLTPQDLVDPKAPSATILLAEYFGISDNPHIGRIVEMATLSDTGQYNELLYIIDKIIKCNSRNPEALIRIAWAVARHADRFMEDEWLRTEYNRLEPVISRCKSIARKIVDEYLIKRNIRYLIAIVENSVPRICLGDIMYNYMKAGGSVIILINTMQEKDEYCPTLVDSIKRPSARISIRVSNADFDARSFLEKFGGGGHRVAAGAKIDLNDLGRFIYEAIRALQNIADIIGFLRINSGFVENDR